MKKMIYGVSALALAFGLSACGNDDPSVDSDPKEKVTIPENEPEQKTTPEDNDQANSGNKSTGQVSDENVADQMAELEFIKFDLEVDYGPDSDFDFEYEQKDENGKYEAELKDEVHNKILKGSEAFQALYTPMQNITFSADTPKEEVIQQTLDAFQLEDNYKKFELEYTKKDGTKVEVKDRK